MNQSDTNVAETKNVDYLPNSEENYSYNLAIISMVLKFLLLLMPKTIATRLLCMILIAGDVPPKRISELSGACLRTVYQLKRDILSGNKRGFFSIERCGQKCKFEDFEEDIIAELNKNNYYNRRQIIKMIEEKFGIKVSKTTVSRLLKKHGLKHLKCGSLPSKGDPIKQREFHDNVMQPLIKEANEKKIELFYVDAAHFVMGNGYLGRVYSTIRRWISTSSGRKRYNVLGALNMVGKKLTTITNCKYINAESCCELLRKLATEYIGKTIVLLLDNAKYQKCQLVFEEAERLGIKLVFLTTYSPNLNLIERFWRHVKGQLRTNYYDNFSDFCTAIDSIIACESSDEKKAIDRSINENFQFFDDFVKINESTSVKNSGKK
jgi:transposase